MSAVLPESTRAVPSSVANAPQNVRTSPRWRRAHKHRGHAYVAGAAWGRRTLRVSQRRATISRDAPPQRSIPSEASALPDAARRPRPRRPPLPGRERRPRSTPTTATRRRGWPRCGPTRGSATPRTCAAGSSRSPTARRSTTSGRGGESPVPVGDVPETRGRAATPPTPPDDGLWALVRELPAKQRTALALRYVADAGYDEISAVMGTSEDAARRNVHEALKRLRTEYRAMTDIEHDLQASCAGPTPGDHCPTSARRPPPRGLLDVAYATLDSPAGHAAAGRHARGAWSGSPTSTHGDEDAACSSTSRRPSRPRSWPRPAGSTSRGASSTSTSPARRRQLRGPARLAAHAAASPAACWRRPRGSRSARPRPTSRWRREAGSPRALARRRQRARLQPDPDRRPLPPDPALGRRPRRLHGRRSSASACCSGSRATAG